MKANSTSAGVSAGYRLTLTDLGNAERFAEQHGADVRYCYLMAKWFIFDGTRWVVDDSGIVEARMKNTVRRIYSEATDADDRADRKAIADHAKRSESHSRISAALALARSEPGIPVRPTDFDSNPWLLNCENGTIDLRTGERREHRRGDLITKLAPAPYISGARAPVFDEFLKRILPSEELRNFVQRLVGYAATGDVSKEILTILHGVGANGKSTLVNAVMEALGDYAMQAAKDLLLAKRDSHPTELADLFGARFVASVETDEGRRLNEGLVKQLTGRDPIKARRMREDFWQFNPTHTVFLATNHKPEIRGTDHAIWRRIRLIPFEVTIPESEQDQKLPEKLKGELPGILAWVVRGCLECYAKGLEQPQEVVEATQEYRSEMDVLGGFIEECCAVNPSVRANATQLYTEYVKWCERNGENAEKQTKFGLRLGERGFRKDKSGTVTWYGIGIRFDRPDPDGSGGGQFGKSGDHSGQFADNRPDGESRTPKPDAEKFHEASGQSGPFSGLNGAIEPREAVNPKSGPNCPNRPEIVSGGKRHSQGKPKSQQGSLRSAKEGSKGRADGPLPSLAVVESRDRPNPENDVVEPGMPLTSEEVGEYNRLRAECGYTISQARRTVLNQRKARLKAVGGR